MDLGFGVEGLEICAMYVEVATTKMLNEPEMIEFSFSSFSIVWHFIIQQTNHSRAVQYSPIWGIDHIFIRIHDRSFCRGN